MKLTVVDLFFRQKKRNAKCIYVRTEERRGI